MPLVSLLEVANLTVLDPRRARWGQYAEDAVRVLDAVSLSVEQGRTVAVVGETGSGTLSLALALVGLVPAAGGDIRYDGRSLVGLGERRLRPFRREIQVLFSDAFGALPPHQTVARTLQSTAAFAASRRGRDRIGVGLAVERALEKARLSLLARPRRPAELAPDERQRAQLARALLMEPRLLVCHDFTRGLDASLQAALLNRLCDLRDELGLSLLVLTHDLAVADHLASEIHILSRGRIVESGPPDLVTTRPRHEYTRRLVAAALAEPGDRAGEIEAARQSRD